MQNLLVLTGLGTSLCVGGPTMEDLWVLCVGDPPSSTAAETLERLQYDADRRNIEELLSRCDAQLQASSAAGVVAEFRNSAISKILQRCREVAAEGQDLSAHLQFIRRLARRRVRDPRLRLFTTNYDLSFETVAGELGLTTIDGFSFSRPRRFDPRYFDYDIVRRIHMSSDGPAYVPGVFQYFKLHGSVDWCAHAGSITIDDKVDPSEACLIYPTHQKFQLSYQQPHLELIARFLASLREPNTCLLVVGFGFNDAHLTEPILSALSTNPHLRVIVASPNCDKHLQGGSKPVWVRFSQAHSRGDDVAFVRASFPQFVPNIPDLRVLTPSERLERDIRQLARIDDD